MFLKEHSRTICLHLNQPYWTLCCMCLHLEVICKIRRLGFMLYCCQCSWTPSSFSLPLTFKNLIYILGLYRNNLKSPHRFLPIFNFFVFTFKRSFSFPHFSFCYCLQNKTPFPSLLLPLSLPFFPIPFIASLSFSRFDIHIASQERESLLLSSL